MINAIKDTKTMKRAGIGFLGGAMLVLAGCGNDSDTLTEARTVVHDASTLTSSTEVTMDMDESMQAAVSEDGNATDTVSMVMNSKLNIDMMSDLDAGQHEMNIGATIGGDGASMSFELPVFMDEDNQALYTSAKGLTDLMGMIMPITLPDEDAGKVVDLSDGLEAESTDAGVFEGLSAKESTDMVNDIVKDYTNSLPDDALTVDGDTYTQVFNGDAFVAHMLTELEAREAITAEDVESFKDEVDGSLSIGDVTVVSTITDGNLVSEDYSIPVNMLIDGEPDMAFTLNTATSYTGVNEAVEFTMNTDEDNVLTMEEFEVIIQDASMSLYDTESDSE